jgi:hypothetical protein
MVGAPPVRVIFLLVLAACTALCQEPQERLAWNSLPDAPSAKMLQMFVGEARLPLTAGADAVFTHESEQANGSQVAGISSFGAPDKQEPAKNDPGNFLGKYLHSSLTKRNPGYRPSTSDSLVGRAGYAASSIFVTHDNSGRSSLNTSYFVGVLSSAIVHTAYRPYWRRSYSEPFADFGSNIGNDAGMNFLHEFGPGIEQLMKTCAPRFVYKIESRVRHD